jgi:hypothetical protein
MRPFTSVIIEQENEMKRDIFRTLGVFGQKRYTEGQKQYAIEQAKEIGVRATARLLYIPRKTLQKWLRFNDITVSRYPAWLPKWVERRNRRWERIQRAMG